MKKSGIPHLTEALKLANEAAVHANDAYGPPPNADGGSCNFDSPSITFDKGTRRAYIEAAALAAGVSVYRDTWGGYVFGMYSDGQGFRRTRSAEAAAAVLKAHGYRGHVRYMLD